MKIGHTFDIPDEYKNTDVEINNLGGYQVISDFEKGILIKGNRVINLFGEKISACGILPLDVEMQESLLDFPFEIEKHRLVYQVSFNNNAWYFTDKNIAFDLITLITSVKEFALHTKYLETKSKQN